MSSLSRPCLQLLGVWFVMLLVSSGCRPDFDAADTCTSNADCFADEICMSGVCVLDGSSSAFISSFTGSAQEVERGGSVDLSWQTRNAKTASISGTDGFTYEIPEAQRDSGSVVVDEINEDVEFTLTVVGEDGFSSTRSVDVTVAAARVEPSIELFEATPEQINPGDMVTIRWKSTGAESGVITGGESDYNIPVGELDEGEYQVLPNGPVQYELTVTNSLGMVKESVQVSLIVPDPPTVQEFVADKSVVAAGESVELSWETTDAESITIKTLDNVEVFSTSDAQQVGKGTTSLTVDATTTYTLSATGPGGTVAATNPVMVEVQSLPLINGFTASQANDITPGAMISLTWNVTGADNITITDSSDVEIAASADATGSVMYRVDASTTLTLTASNAVGMVTEEVSLSLLGGPVINSFTSSESVDVPFGTTVTLSWDVTGADGIEITNLAGGSIVNSSDATGSTPVLVNKDETYTLTATNAAGSVTEQVSITLLSPPMINTFIASKTTGVIPGEVVTLSWDVSEADSITITDSSMATITTSTMSSGSFDVTVNVGETYKLTATNNAGSIERSVSVALLPAPLILNFFASQTSGVVPGANVTFSWSTSGSDSIEIRDSSGAPVITSTMGSGSDFVTINSNETFTLYALNQGGETTSMPVQITILGSPVVNNFAASRTADVVPGSTVTLSWSVTDAASITITDSSLATIATSTTLDSSVDVIVNADETYTIAATNATGTTTDSVVVTVLTPPTVIGFNPSQDVGLLPGEMVTLLWDVTGADNITITDSTMTTVAASMMASGSTTFAVSQDETYTLTATNAAGSTTATATVTLLPMPSISQFFASQTAGVVPGATVTLSWDVSDAESVTITDSAMTTIATSMMAVGSTSVTVNADESYTLTATNSRGDVSSSPIDITVLTAPTITSFAASQTVDVVPGSTVTLSWDVMGATSVTITDSAMTTIATSSMAVGSTSVTVSADETYTLTATNAAGQVMDTVSVTVLDAPTISSFTASQTMGIMPGATISLSWEVAGADHITITNNAMMTLATSTMATGSVSVMVNANETYTLTASNAAGMVTDDVSVTIVMGPLPSVSDFEADKVATVSGERVELTWLTADVTSATITDDQGGTTYNVPMGDLDAGSVVVRPQVSTVYTFTAINAVGMVTSMETVTVNAAELLISEVLYDPANTDGDREWVELYNAGDTFVDLGNYSLGAGGADYTTTKVQLSSTLLAPKATFVVGGASDADNFMPSLDQVAAFAAPGSGGGLQNGGSSTDGVALFFAKAADVDAMTVPIDSVLWDSPNSSALLGEDGMPDTEFSPDVTDVSLVRVSGASDVFVSSGAGFPGLPLFVSSVSPVRGPNQATDFITISGYGFDDNLDSVMLGATPLTCASSATEMLCQLDLTTPSSDSGSVSLTITRTQRYAQHPMTGAPVLEMIPIMEQRSFVLADAFFFDAQEADTGADFYCATLDPVTSTATAGDAIAVELVLYAQGSTEAPTNSLPAGWVLEAGYFTRAALPYEVLDATWVRWDSNGANGSAQREDMANLNNEIFSLELVSMSARLAEVGWRVSRDGGTTWIYCDTETLANGSDDGWDAAGGADVEWN